MLGKLTKYEIKSTAGTFLLIYAAVLVLAVVNRILYAFNFNHMFSSSSFDLAWVGNLLTGLFTGLYILMIVAMFVAVMIVVIMRFYRNMFSSEGYLMHTLPVKPWQHIVSKLLASALWMVGSVIVMCLSLVVLLSHREVYESFAYAIAEIAKAFAELEFSITPFIIEFVVLIVISLFTYALPIYACICIGQLWKKHRVLGAFVSYMILNFVTQIIGGISGGGIGYSFARRMDQLSYYNNNASEAINEVLRFSHSLVIFSLVFMIVLNVVYFFICNYVMSRRLDLE